MPTPALIHMVKVLHPYPTKENIAKMTKVDMLASAQYGCGSQQDTTTQGLCVAVS